MNKKLKDVYSAMATGAKIIIESERGTLGPLGPKNITEEQINRLIKYGKKVKDLGNELRQYWNEDFRGAIGDTINAAITTATYFRLAKGGIVYPENYSESTGLQYWKLNEEFKKIYEEITGYKIDYFGIINMVDERINGANKEKFETLDRYILNNYR